MTFQTNFPLYPTKLPYVVASAKGMSNGMSNIPNDGFDFGPDTMLGTSLKGLYGPPYSTTLGIQEAVNYVIANAEVIPNEATPTAKIQLLTEIYRPTGTVTIPSNATNINYLTIEGIAEATQIDLTDIPAGQYFFNISNMPNLYRFTFGGMRYQSTSSTGSGGLLNDTNPSGYRYYHDINQGTVGFAQYSVNINTESINMIFENCNGGASFEQGWYVSGTSTSSLISQVTLLHSGAYFSLNYIRNAIFLGTHVAIANLYNIDKASFIGCHNLALTLNNDITSLDIIGCETFSGATTLIFNANLTIGELLIDGLTYIPLGVEGHLFSGSSYIYSLGNYHIRNFINQDPTYAFTGAPGDNTPGAAPLSTYVIAPTTPSVPASGTAVKNLNTYAVEIYLNGGAVTQVQRTIPNGTAYTVFTSSSAVALAGLTVRLEPGDTITLTYTTAPTWSWVQT